MAKLRTPNSPMCSDLQSLTTRKFYNEEALHTRRLTSLERVTYLTFQRLHNLFFSSESCLNCWNKLKIFAKTLQEIHFLTLVRRLKSVMWIRMGFLAQLNLDFCYKSGTAASLNFRQENLLSDLTDRIKALFWSKISRLS